MGVRSTLSRRWRKLTESNVASNTLQDGPISQLEYQYEPLPEGSVRMLTVQPGSAEDELVGKLEVVKLDSCSPYEPISYVWGDPTLTSHIRIAGARLPLTQSLDIALRRFRLADRPRRLWADQACINQRDLVERSHQVRHMQRIFKGAERVLMWLGEVDDETARRASALIELLWNGLGSYDDLPKFEDMHPCMSSLTDDDWFALRQLLDLPYFRRVWIVPEAGTAAPALICWGREAVVWRHFSFVVWCLYRKFRQLRRRLNLVTFRAGRLYLAFHKHSEWGAGVSNNSIVYLLHQNRHKAAADPRDHIFAFLGHYLLPSGQNGEAFMESDYMMPVEDVYRQFTIGMLKATKKLDVLNTIQHHEAEIRDSTFVAPTWVTRWDQRIVYNIVNVPGDRYYRATKSLDAIVEFGDVDKTLVMAGIRLDVVEKTTPMITEDSFGMRKSPSERQGVNIERLWNIISGCFDFDLQVQHSHGKGALDVFLGTLTCGTLLGGGLAWLQSVHKIDTPQEDNISGENLKSMKTVVMDWVSKAEQMCHRRRLATTKGGYWVLCPHIVQEGDVLCVLFGGRTPYLLRPHEDHFLFVGECYADGLMFGEVIDASDRGQWQMETFQIR